MSQIQHITDKSVCSDGVKRFYEFEYQCAVKKKIYCFRILTLILDDLHSSRINEQCHFFFLHFYWFTCQHFYLYFAVGLVSGLNIGV